MKKIALLLVFALLGCKAAVEAVAPVKVGVILEKSGPVRALEVSGDTIWYGGLNKFGWVLRDGKSKTWDFKAGTDVDFRSIAQTNSDVFVLNAGSPAWLLRINKKTQVVDTVHTDSNPAIFYDSMKFYDNERGLALADPIDGRFTLLATTDSGRTWTMQKGPEAMEGEGAFAASNSNLVLMDNATYFVSGGKHARFFRQDSQWESNHTPIVQGQAMTGIFTADFYDRNIGIIAGGNYEDQKNNTRNKAVTRDGGRNWKAVADGEAFGYASCVRYFPGSGGKKIASVGATGLWISNNGGTSWKKIHDNAGWYTIRFINSRTAVVAGRFEIAILEF